VTPIAFAHWCAYQARIKISGEKLRAKLVATVRTVLQVHQVARILPQVARQGPTRVALPNVNPAIPASTTTYRVKRPWQVAKAVVLASTTIKPVNAGAKSAVQEHSTIKRLQLAAKNVVRASTTRKQINRLSPVVKNAKLAGTTTKRLCLTARNARLASTTTKRLQWVAKNAVRASTTIKPVKHRWPIAKNVPRATTTPKPLNPSAKNAALAHTTRNCRRFVVNHAILASTWTNLVPLLVFLVPWGNTTTKKENHRKNTIANIVERASTTINCLLHLVNCAGRASTTTSTAKRRNPRPANIAAWESTVIGWGNCLKPAVNFARPGRTCPRTASLAMKILFVHIPTAGSSVHSQQK